MPTLLPPHMIYSTSTCLNSDKIPLYRTSRQLGQRPHYFPSWVLLVKYGLSKGEEMGSAHMVGGLSRSLHVANLQRCADNTGAFAYNP